MCVVFVGADDEPLLQKTKIVLILRFYFPQYFLADGALLQSNVTLMNLEVYEIRATSI